MSWLTSSSIGMWQVWLARDWLKLTPKTELVARALSAAEVANHEAVMVGDRSYDVVGAIANQVLPVAALWGYGSEDELKAAGCRHFARSPDEFREAFVESDKGFFGDRFLTAAVSR